MGALYIYDISRLRVKSIDMLLVFAVNWTRRATEKSGRATPSRYVSTSVQCITIFQDLNNGLTTTNVKYLLIHSRFASFVNNCKR